MNQSDLHDIDFEARIRLRRGETAEQLAAELVSLGFSQSESAVAAAQAVSRLTSKDKSADRGAAFANLGVGALLFVVGMGVTILTLSSGNGGVIAYGAIGVGGWRIVVGLMQLLQ